MRPSRVRVVLLLAMVPVASAAHAHDVHLFATSDGKEVHGRAYFAGDVPAAGLTVNVLTLEGTPLGVAETDAEGRFVYVPDVDAPLHLVIETLDGHRATFTLDRFLPVRSVEDYVVPLGGENFELEAMQLELRERLEDLDREKNRVRLRNVIGGIGYIVGVMGLIAFWKARSGKGRS